MKKTHGLIGTEQNRHLLSDDDRRAWDEAIAEARRLLGREQ